MTSDCRIATITEVARGTILRVDDTSRPNPIDANTDAPERGLASRDLPRLALLVLGTLTVIFGVFEVLERTVLANAEPGTLHTLHLVRGLASSILVAVLVATLTDAEPGLARAANGE